MEYQYNGKPFPTKNEFCKSSGLSLYFVNKRLAENKCPHIMSGNRVKINASLFLKQLEEESKVQE